VESRDQVLTVARSVRESGASILRGGAFKPRTSPYDFQGLHAQGIELLLEAKKETGLPIISEIMNINDLDLFADVDIIQVGARNMQNFDLLKTLVKRKNPSCSNRAGEYGKELLMSAEYIMAAATKTSFCASAASARSRRTRATRLTSRPLRRCMSCRICLSSSTPAMPQASRACRVDGACRDGSGSDG
jgi:3-deoxy-7-phosphoheptulonate synthase